MRYFIIISCFLSWSLYGGSWEREIAAFGALYKGDARLVMKEVNAAENKLLMKTICIHKENDEFGYVTSLR